MASRDRSGERAGSFTLETGEDGVAVVTLDVPEERMNVLRREHAAELREVLEQLRAAGGVRAAVLVSGKPDSFVAGADIAAFEALASAAEARALSGEAQAGFGALERAVVPVVAAIHGTCLGGGLELALACRARVCSAHASTVLGLPEVQLGLLPGAGGTQRLPRLVGIERALDALLTGRRLRPADALRIGLVDDVVRPSILLAAARRLALELAAGGVAPRRGPAPWSLAYLRRALLERNPYGRDLLFQQAHKRLRARTRGCYPAPPRIVECVETGIEHGMPRGLELERTRFGELAVSPESRALVGLYRASTALKSERRVRPWAPRPVRRAAVLGGGLMGAGIACVTVDRAGIPVRLRDVSEAGIGHALGYVDERLRERVRRRRLDRQEAARRLRLLTATTDWTGFARADLVVEAVFEDLELKRDVLREAEAVLPSHAVIASNTSSIPIARIAEASARPESVLGMHYFSPVERMPLLEVVVTPRTAAEATATAVELGRTQGKTVVVVNDGPGFYTSRILAPFLNEAGHLLAEGLTVEAVDEALRDRGFPVGPLTLLDEVGLDVATKIGPVLVEAFGARMQAHPGVSRLVSDGRKGRKSGRGFYRYEEGAGKRVDEVVYRAFESDAGAHLEAAEIAERCLLQMVNEAVRCLEDGVLDSPRDGDVGAVYGLGFPPFLGGPFRYADALGAGALRDRLESLRERHGERFAPAPLLADTARRGARFHDARAGANPRA